MSNHEPLRDALRHRADQLGDTSPLTLDDIKGRARGIRRRRAAVSGLAAAAVLAVAVPVGIAVTDGLGTDPENPPVAGPSVTPSEGGESTPDPVPVPEGPQRVTLTTDAEPADSGDMPSISFLYDGAIQDGGRRVPVEADYAQIAPVGDGWAATRNDNGDFFVDFLDSDGNVTGSEPSTWSLAASVDGTVAAYATPDGELMTVTVDDGPVSLVDPAALPPGILEPVAVIGSDSCSPDAAGGGCAVFFNSADVEEQSAWSATAKGIVSPFPGLLSLGGIAPDGSVSGTISTSMDGSCSAVLGPDRGKKVWETCDYSLGRFSPDGRYVIGHPAYQSGFGDASVAILDARTGNLLAEFQNSREHPASIFEVVWDRDNTLVATVFEEGSWGLMRMTAEGELLTLVRNEDRTEEDVPVRFSVQP